MAGESGLGSPAVEYTLVGVADDELFARAELLAELLSRSLPNFAMKKVVVSQERWADTIRELMETRFALTTASSTATSTTPRSPFIYRVLGEANPAAAAVGDAPSICVTPQPVGGFEAFRNMAQQFYAMKHSASKEEVDAAIAANVAISTAEPRITRQLLSDPPVTVVVHNSASLVAYQFLSRVAAGDVFGEGTTVNLRLVDTAETFETLEAVQMELEDCASPYLGTVTRSINLDSAVSDANLVIFFTEAMHGTTGQCTLESLQAVAAFGAVLKPGTRVLMVGAGSASAACVLAAAAVEIPRTDISVLARVPQIRGAACIANQINSRVTKDELRISGAHVRNVIAWGSDITQPIIDTSFGLVLGHGGVVGAGMSEGLNAVLREPSFLVDNEDSHTLDGALRPESLHGWVQDRDAAVAGGAAFAPSMTVVTAMVDHLRAWCGQDSSTPDVVHAPTKYFDTFGMWSNGNSFGIPDSLYFPFPSAGCAIVAGLVLDREIEQKILDAARAAVKERNRCLELVGLTLEGCVSETPAPDIPVTVTIEADDDDDDDDGGTEATEEAAPESDTTSPTPAAGADTAAAT